MAEFREITAIKQLNSLDLRSKLSVKDQKVYDAMITDLKKTQDEFNVANESLSEKTAALDKANALLVTRTTELDNANQQLKAQSSKLKDTESLLSSRTLELDNAKIMLDSQSVKLTDTEKLLADRTLDLDSANIKLDTLSLKLTDVEKSLASKILELRDVKTTLESKESELKSKDAELKLQSEAFADLSNKLTAANTALLNANEKQTASYTVDDISSFLNNSIKEFNENKASDSDAAKYVINGMDVDLKVRIFDDGKNGEKSLKFLAPKVGETSEDSLSSLKFSIQAVPK